MLARKDIDLNSPVLIPATSLSLVTVKDSDAFSNKLNHIDNLIRSGQGKLARQDLEKLGEDKVPRSHAIRFAALAWRANVPNLGLRALYPVVRPERGILSKPTDEEVVEYAACLTKVGAAEEALALLERIDVKMQPRALLFKAFALISRWNYAESIPLLSEYVKAKSLVPYQRLVGLVNLSAALIYERQYDEAAKHLEELIRETQKDRYHLLLGNSLELSAASFILQDKLPEAKGRINQAKELLKDTGTLDEFFVRKWEAILDFLTHVKSPKTVNVLHQIRQEAENRKHWETVRDCDRYEAIARGDEKLLTFLYFGTPFESFRARLLADFKLEVTLPNQYSWSLGNGKGPEIDLLLPISKEKGELREGQLLHRLLTALGSDFYRPIRVAPLHFKLYPEEFFNPVSSPARIHVAVGRLREWFKKNKVFLTITEDSGAYRLQSEMGCRLLVPRVAIIRKTTDAVLEKLRNKFPSHFFTAKEAAEYLESSPRTVLRLLTTAIEEKRVEKTGVRASVKYRFRQAS